jgi:acyl-[acyl-carrier-protein]-phospholipid O-acyltransferase/long-chain-fatty-acid--[acyl-carrier-protein] ligase
MILHHQFIKSAKQNKKKIAIKDRTTGSVVPYSRALIGAFILAKKFKAYEGKYLGIMVPTSAGCILSCIGALFAGKIPVMINYSTGAEENSNYAQEKCGFTNIITSKALLDKIHCPLLPGMVCLEDIMASVKELEKIGTALKTLLPVNTLIKSLPKADIDDTVVILFTSGSEKDPKAVQLTHRNIGSNIEGIWECMGIKPNDIIFSILPLFHVFGHTVDFWLPMTQGLTAVTYANPLEYKTVPKIAKEELCTMMAATPIFFSGYLRESTPGDFKSIWLAVVGADKAPESLRTGYREKHGVELAEGYGTTETSPVISVNRINNNRPGSIGELLPGVEVKITSIETGEVLPPGEEGKILVKGDLVMKGYLDPIKTKEAIKEGWYDTGDIGVLDKDGFLWHKGRLKRFVKVGGEMVSLVKTESEIETLLPAGVECCVVDIPDEVKGSILVGALTKEIDTGKIIQDLKGKLAPIAIPKKYMILDELPKMGSGKIDFRTLTTIVREKFSS